MSIVLPANEQHKSNIVPQEAAFRVAKGSIGISAISASYGMLNAALRAQPAVLYAYQSGINTFLFAFPILAIREYVVGPLLRQWSEEKDKPAPGHFTNMTESIISGSIVGGALSAHFKGRNKFLPGMSTFGILCAGLQLAANEFNLARLRILATTINKEEIEKIEISSSIANNNSIKNIENQNPSASIKRSNVENEEVKSQNSSLSKLKNFFLWLSPLKQMSDEDYQLHLESKRDAIRSQIHALDQSIVKLENDEKIV